MTYTVLAVVNILFAAMIAVSMLAPIAREKFWEDMAAVVLTFIWLALYILNAIALLMR